MNNPNYRANWLDRWGYRVPPLESTQPSDPQLLAEKKAQKLVEKEVQERVDKALQPHAKYMTEEIKQEIKAIIAEAQAKIGFAPDSPKLSLVPAKPEGISLKTIFSERVIRH